MILSFTHVFNFDTLVNMWFIFSKKLITCHNFPFYLDTTNINTLLTIYIKRIYSFDAILKYKKKTEGRVSTGIFSKIKVGDKIYVAYRKYTSLYCVPIIITKISIFENFQDLIKNKHDTLNPDTSVIDLYNLYRNYYKKVKKKILGLDFGLLLLN